jgi:hypothetical protein
MRNKLYKGHNIQEFSFGDTSVGITSSLHPVHGVTQVSVSSCVVITHRMYAVQCWDASSKGRIVQRTHRPRDASSKGRIVQGTHRPKDASSKGRIVQGTHRPRDASSKGRIVQGIHRPKKSRSGSHRSGHIVMASHISVCAVYNKQK